MKKMVLFTIFLWIMFQTITVCASDEEWLCPNCGATAKMNFCSECGEPKPSEEWACSNCGEMATGNFCSNCGTPFEHFNTDDSNITRKETETNYNDENNKTEEEPEFGYDGIEDTDLESVFSIEDVDWYEFSASYEDTEGYTFEIVYKISPWILQSNTDLVNEIWNDIGEGIDLPTFSDWGLNQTSNYYERLSVTHGGSTLPFIHEMNDMYYCLGTVTINNITPGWSITEDNPRSLQTKLAVAYPEGGSLRYYSEEQKKNHSSWYGAYAIGRTFYTNEIDDNADEASFRPKMYRDSWGSVPFILMTPENFSPNYPNGKYLDYLLSCPLYYGNNESINIGAINKEGLFIPPVTGE